MVRDITAAGAERQRLMELGMVGGAEVECVLRRKNIAAFLVRGTVIALRERDSARILVEAPAAGAPAERSCAVWL